MEKRVTIQHLFMIILPMILLIPVTALGQVEEYAWYFNDGPDVMYTWTDTGIAQFWERMGPDEIEVGDLTCAIADLPIISDQTSYWACSYPETRDYLDTHFRAEIYFDNNYPDQFYTVTVDLGKGVCGDPGSFVALGLPVSVIVNTDGNIDCGVLYTFDFGVFDEVSLVDESLIVKITYEGDNYDTHIYWDSECCPSALLGESGTAVRESNFSVIKSLY